MYIYIFTYAYVHTYIHTYIYNSASLPNLPIIIYLIAFLKLRSLIYYNTIAYLYLPDILYFLIFGKTFEWENSELPLYIHA